MKYEITQYKGQTIEYDETDDKFVCDIVIEDRNKTVKRLSLKAIKKEIDTFVKINVEFKPFKVIELSYCEEMTVNDVVALRTDGLFVKQGKHFNSHIDLTDKKESDKLRTYDCDVVKDYNLVCQKEKLYDEEIKVLKKAIVDKLKPIDNEFYKNMVSMLKNS